MESNIPEKSVTNLAKRASRLGALYFILFYGAIAAALPFLNVYYDAIGLTGAQIGWLGALNPVSALAIAPVVSVYADRLGRRRRFLQLGLLLSAVFFFLIGQMNSFQTILLVTICYAIFSGFLGSLADAIIVRTSKTLGLNFGAIRLWGSVSFAIVVTICGLVWRTFGFGGMFLVMGLGFLPVIWIAGQFDEPVGNAQAKSAISFDLIKSIWPLILIVFFTGMTFHTAVSFEGILLTRIGGTSAEVGYIFGIAAVVEVPLMFYIDAIARRLGGYTRTLGIGLVLYLTTMIGYLIAPTPAVVLLFGGLRGASFAFWFISMVQLFDQQLSADNAASAQSLRTAASYGIAPLFASLIAGYVLDSFGIRAVFVTGVVAMLCAVSIFAWSLLTKRLVDIA